MNEAMLWSAEALKAIEAAREIFGEGLQRRARERAKRDGRNLVTDDDVAAALVDMEAVADFGG